jgi:hypothetical protein
MDPIGHYIHQFGPYLANDATYVSLTTLYSNKLIPEDNIMKLFKLAGLTKQPYHE